MADSVRVLTYNILAHDAGWDQRQRVIRHGLAQLQPDLLCLQETLVAGSDDQSRDILEPGYHTIHSNVRSAEGMGISIASRWPIVDVEEIDLRGLTMRTSDFPATALIALIGIPQPFGRTVLVNHFPDYQVSHEHEREVQTVLVANTIEATWASRARHVLLAGDLDAEADAASLRFLTGKQSLGDSSICYVNAWDWLHPGQPGHTFVSRNDLAPKRWPFRRLDHILVRCGERNQPTLDIASASIAFDEPAGGIWGSDHFAVMADLRPPATD